jgi:putative ABC transport system permease protein
MLRVALKMLMGDRAKYLGLLFGITFTSYLVTFAASYFCGFMTRGYALIAENGEADVWIMDPAVASVEQTTNMVASALDRVRSVEGVASAVPLALGTAEARFPNGRVQSFQVIGVDDATLSGVPALEDGASPSILRAPDAAIVDAGGTEGKLETPLLKVDQWPREPHLDAPRACWPRVTNYWSMTTESRLPEGRRPCLVGRQDHCFTPHSPTPPGFCCPNGDG